jgi:hypothetical protein
MQTAANAVCVEATCAVPPGHGKTFIAPRAMKSYKANPSNDPTDKIRNKQDTVIVGRQHMIQQPEHQAEWYESSEERDKCELKPPVFLPRRVVNIHRPKPLRSASLGG